jgi:ubiquinone/menaquinone biosynthesis C-methylase UbiE
LDAAMKPLKDRAASTLKKAAKAALSPFSLTISRIPKDQGCTLEWVAESGLQGMALNDYIEKDQRKPALAELRELVFPRVSPRAVVCELGPGTGVYTRHLNDYIEGGELHVVDADGSAVEFLRRHLPTKPGTHLYLNSGTALPFDADGWIDLVFCASMFTGGNLSYFYRYLQEFARVLKPGGWCVFDYFDVASEAGWRGLTRNMARKQPIFAYAYHATDTVDRVMEQLGLQVVGRHPTPRGSVFVSARKP